MRSQSCFEFAFCRDLLRQTHFILSSEYFRFSAVFNIGIQIIAQSTFIFINHFSLIKVVLSLVLEHGHISSPPDTAPELQYTFIEQVLRPGQVVTLKCSASGAPPPHFTWLLDHQPLNVMARGHRYLFLAICQLT